MGFIGALMSVSKFIFTKSKKAEVAKCTIQLYFGGGKEKKRRCIGFFPLFALLQCLY